MGSFTFRWEHPAQEVFVTGTFDNWAKSVQLDKQGDIHEKTVDLPSNDKVLYKFVADGEWKYDHTAKTEADHEGNLNNVVYPEDIQPSTATSSSSNPAAAFISTVAPGATTAAMAGQQPREVTSSAPGAFPETPAPNDDQTFSVNPIPASAGTGNPDPPAINTNTIESTVHDDPELKSKDQGEQTFGVAPIPASSGISNPIQLAPGEKVPDSSTFNANTVDSTAKYDQASYERSDAGPTSFAPPANLQEQNIPATAILAGPGPVIPESSIPMGNTTDISKADVGPTISSASATSTTAALAGQVPKEPRGVPEVVSESQQEANAAPEASANPVAVEEKKDVESELQSKVAEAPSTSESGLLGKSEDGIGAKVAAGVAAGGVAAAGAAVAANELLKEKTGTDAKAALPESVQKTVDEKAAESTLAPSTTTDSARATTSTVPEEVTASQKEAGFASEAASSPEAVKEKSAFENELLQKVPESNAQGMPAGGAVPQEVQASQSQAGVSAEAAANPEAVTEKSAVEQELLKKVPESEAQGEPAPTASAAAATTAPTATDTTSATGAPQLGDPTAGVAPISMDDSALNAPGSSAAAVPSGSAKEGAAPDTVAATDSPSATTGVASAAIPRTNAASNSTPAKRMSLVDRFKGTPESSKTAATPSTPDSKKEKRKSLFGRIKEKLKN